MIPKTQGKDVELFIIQAVYKKEKIRGRNEFGMIVNQEKEKFIKEVYAKVWMDKNEIGPYGQYIGSKGELLKNRTLLFNRVTDTYYKVAHSLDEIRQVIQYGNAHIGYKKAPNEV